MAKSTELRELVRRSYQLGYEIGYYGHYEFLGWVVRERRQIESLAGGPEDLTKLSSAYHRGKERGASRRRLEFNTSSQSDVGAEEQDLPDVDHDWRRARTPSPGHIRPRALSQPRIMQSEEFLDIPGILKKVDG